MARAAQADPEAQRELVLRVLPTVRRAVARLVVHVADREDVAQLSLIEVLRCAESWRGEGDLEAWARRIAIFQTLKYLRSEQRRAKHLEVLSGPTRAHEPPLSESLPRSIEEYLHRLPDKQRVAVVLRHGFGYSVGEIAELTAAPANTVKARLLGGRKRLRELVEHDRQQRPASLDDVIVRTGTR
jgi:RNA polymerase sigma-70 factor (ECF subfamily)